MQGLILPKEVGRVQAVNQISFQLYQGETLGIIGESGCGKTTLARVVMGLEDATSGSITFLGQEIKKRHVAQPAPAYANGIPGSILFPGSRMSVKTDSGRTPKNSLPYVEDRKKRTDPSPSGTGGSFRRCSRAFSPMSFLADSGSESEIARALVLEPELLICDEPVSPLMYPSRPR